MSPRVRRLTPYLVLGLGLRYFVHESGVHATIAGVVLAFAIPTRTRINTSEFSARARRWLDDFDRTETGDRLVLTSTGQQEAIVRLERASEEVTPPLLRLEHALRGFSAFVVMPLFALSNAGVSLGGSSGGKVTLAVILGLTIGKPLGITGAAMAAGPTPAGGASGRRHMDRADGCAWLGGIGFTMSLFIATLAFRGTQLLDSAKIGILVALFCPASSARSYCSAELAEAECRRQSTWTRPPAELLAFLEPDVLLAVSIIRSGAHRVFRRGENLRGGSKFVDSQDSV